MKKMYVLIFMLVFVFSGCAENKPENNTKTAIDHEIIWRVDLDHDGNEDIMKVEILNDSSTGEGAKVSVFSADDLIYSATADLPHTGWNGFYLYEDENGAYLLHWRPTMYQGYASYTYAVFSFNAKGEQVFLDSGSLEFDSREMRAQYEGVEEFVKYIQTVNGYLNSSLLIVDTDNGTLLYGTQESRVVNPYIPKWLFNIF